MLCSSQKEEEVDKRLVNFILESNDTDLLWDLRKLNGRPKNPAFDPFWHELQKYIDEFAAVDERRHSDILYLPVAISIENLRQIVLDRLPEGSAAPSNSWLYMNFWPSSRYHNSASHHTGRFNLKFKLQQRLVRGQHPDDYYCATSFKFQRTMAVKYREYASMFFVDDKAIFPVGEPEIPVSTNVRARGGALVPGDKILGALDHDFHICGLVPSFVLKSDVPDNVNDSFYKGIVFCGKYRKLVLGSSK